MLNISNIINTILPPRFTKSNNYFKKSLRKTDKSNKCLIPFEFKPIKFDLVSYYKGLKPSEKAVFKHIFSFRKLPWINIRNETVANILNLSVRSIQRAVKKFCQDNLLYKSQENPYAPNDYQLNPVIKSGKRSYTLWMNILDQEQQKFFLNHQALVYPSQSGKYFAINNVIHTINNNIYIKYPITVKSFNANLDGNGNFLKKIEDLFPESGAPMFTEAQTAWLLKLKPKDFAKAKEILSPRYIDTSLFAKHESTDTNNVRNVGESLVRNKLVNELGLCLRDYLKLFVFPESILTHIEKNKFLFGNNSKIKDIPAYLFSLCVKDMKALKLVPDFRIYYKLCEIYGCEAVNPHINSSAKNTTEPKPLKIIIASQKVEAPQPSKQDKIAYFQREILNHQKNIDEARAKGEDKYLISFMVTRQYQDQKMLDSLLDTSTSEESTQKDTVSEKIQLITNDITRYKQFIHSLKAIAVNEESSTLKNYVIALAKLENERAALLDQKKGCHGEH